MKTQTTWGAIRLCILGLLSSLAGLFSVGPSMGAKTGVITAPTGADENLKTLGASQPVRDTLAGIIRTAFSLASALKAAVINFSTRKAFVISAGADYDTPILVPATMALRGLFVKDDPTKPSSPWTFNVEDVGGAFDVVSAAVGLIVNARKPSLSVETLVNQIEDALVNDPSNAAALDALDAEAIILVEDQTLGRVVIYTGTTADAALLDALDFVEDVQYVQTLDSGASQFGE